LSALCHTLRKILIASLLCFTPSPGPPASSYPKWTPSASSGPSVKWTEEKLVDYLEGVISKQENPHRRYHNPGGLIDLPYYRRTKRFRLRTYTSTSAGRAALREAIRRKIRRGESPVTFFSTYAPAGHGRNRPSEYADAAAGPLRINAKTPFSTLLPRKREKEETNPKSHTY